MKTPVFSSAILLPVLMLIPCMPLSADWYGDWEYDEDSTIIGYRGEGGVVTVPYSFVVGGWPIVCLRVRIEGNNNISELVISEGTNNVYIRSFSSLTSISIPSTVNSFENALGQSLVCLFCPNLAQIDVHADNSDFKSVDGVLYSKDGSTMLRYPPGRQGVYSIPSGVNDIGPYACQQMTQSAITIPSGVASISRYAFNAAINLVSVNFETFWNPVSHRWYGLSELGQGAFYGCSALSDMTLPRTLTDAGSFVFGECTSLEEIGVDPNNPNYASVDGIVFNKALTTLLLCPHGKTAAELIPSTVTSIAELAFGHCGVLGSVRLPSSVTAIGQEAFGFCTSLTSIRIPSAVTSVDTYAFLNCYNLTSAYFSGTVAPTIGHDAFQGTAPDFQISFRAGSTDYTTPLWNGYPCFPIANSAPVLTGIGNRTIQIGQTLTFTVQASDANEDDLEFSAVGTAP